MNGILERSEERYNQIFFAAMSRRYLLNQGSGNVNKERYLIPSEITLD